MKTITVVSILLSVGVIARAQSQAPSFTISTVAGTGATAYSGDGGPAISAALEGPIGVAADGTGNLYIADYFNNRIRRVTPGGTISTVAGNGTAGFSGDEGPATSAEINKAYGICVDAAGNLYIADSNNNRIRKVTPVGAITTIAGSGTAGFGGDGGFATSAELHDPTAVAADAAGNLYIADYDNARIRMVTPQGVISTVAGNGSVGYSGDGGAATAAALNGPIAIAVDAAGNLYIGDIGNNRVRKVTPGGTISTIAGSGTAGFSGDGGAATSAELHTPVGLALDASGNLYISDQNNNRIRVLLAGGTIWTIAGNGKAGFGGDDGPATQAEVSSVIGLAVTARGGVYIADGNNNRIRLLSPGLPVSPQFTISTAAGDGTAAYSGDGGAASSAGLNLPLGVALDTTGNLYIADADNNRVREVSTNGTITTVAGNGTAGYSGDGGPADSAELNAPNRLALDAQGNLYIADTANFRVRKVTNGTITTVAGNGVQGYAGDGGLAASAKLNGPVGLAFDAAGNLYIADDANNRIRMVTPGGMITTVAGNGTAAYAGDGGAATAAALNAPAGVTVDAAGNLYVADTGNNRIRKVTNGVVTTVAGNGTSGYTGDGGLATVAQLQAPRATALDSSGNLYIADSGNNAVRVLLSAGTLWTVAGNGSAGFDGDGGPALDAELNSPHGLAIAPSGAIYVADELNQRVRLLTGVPQPPAIMPGGVISAGSFGGFTAVAPGSWVEIYGSNLAGTTRPWASADFSGINAPTSLSGTTVSIGGDAAFLDYISPGQVNAQVPSGVATGSQQVTVTTAQGTSAAYTVTVNAVEPGFLSPPSFTIGAVPYAVATFSDGAYVLPTGALPGVTSRPALPGDVITLYGVGFGPVVPDTPAGQIVQQLNALASSFTMSIGGIAATPVYFGLAPGYVGLYQFNVTVPSAPSGNAPLTFTVAGANGTQTLYIAVGN